MIGIICAMQIEIEEIKKNMVSLKKEIISNVEYITGKLNGIDCVIAVSGVGKVNSAVCTQTMILKFSPKIIINTGIAGGLLLDMNIGDIVIANSTVQHDIDTTAIGDPLGMISTLNIINVPCSQEILTKIVDLKPIPNSTTKFCYNFAQNARLKTEHTNSSKNLKDEQSHEKKFSTCKTKLKTIVNSNSQNTLESSSPAIFVGTIASGDQFIADKKRLLTIKNHFDAIACDMESGSISQVCYLNKTEFIGIRIISDNINSDNSPNDYEKFKLVCAKKIYKYICQFISQI